MDISNMSATPFGSHNGIIKGMVRSSPELKKACLNALKPDLHHFSEKWGLPFGVLLDLAERTLDMGHVPAIQDSTIPQKFHAEVVRFLEMNLLSILESKGDDFLREAGIARANESKQAVSRFLQGRGRPTKQASKTVATVDAVEAIEGFNPSMLDSPRSYPRPINRYRAWGRTLREGERVVLVREGKPEVGIFKRAFGAFALVETITGDVAKVQSPVAGEPTSRDAILPRGSFKESVLANTMKSLRERLNRCLSNKAALGNVFESDAVKQYRNSLGLIGCLVASAREGIKKHPIGGMIRRCSLELEACGLRETDQNESFRSLSERSAVILNSMAEDYSSYRTWTPADVQVRKLQMIKEAATLVASNKNIQRAKSLMGYVSMSEGWWVANQSKVEAFAEAK